MALTDPARRTFAFREKSGRGALGLSGAAAGTLKVWIDDWRAELQGEEFHLQAQDRGLGLDLVLKPLKPPALHGEGGYSRKSGQSDAASYYYSLPRLDTRGTISVDGRKLAVTGESWMDHEFFSRAMAPKLGGLGLVQPPTGGRLGGDALSPAPKRRLGGPGLLGHPHRPPGPTSGN